jgi:hypothetical protein
MHMAHRLPRLTRLGQLTFSSPGPINNQVAEMFSCLPSAGPVNVKQDDNTNIDISEEEDPMETPNWVVRAY